MVVANGAHPTWSPQGDRLAFTRGNEILILDIDFSMDPPAMGAATQLAMRPGDVTGLAWSPEGSLIAFVEDGRIYTMSQDGTGAQLVTNPAAGNVDQDPHWTPDSSSIVLRRGAAKGQPALYLLDLASPPAVLYPGTASLSRLRALRDHAARAVGRGAVRHVGGNVCASRTAGWRRKGRRWQVCGHRRRTRAR